MWICPKCGREFKRINQGHYCGKAPESVDVYISLQEEKARPHLRLLRDIILGSASGIKEKILWSMPTYSLSGCSLSVCSLSFAACKEHVSQYVGSEILRIYEKELEGFQIKKDALYLSYKRDIPSSIIKAISSRVFSCIEEIT